MAKKNRKVRVRNAKTGKFVSSKDSRNDVVHVTSGSTRNNEMRPGVIYTHIYEREAKDMKRLSKWHRASKGSSISKKSNSNASSSSQENVPKIKGFKKTKNGIEPIYKGKKDSH